MTTPRTRLDEATSEFERDLLGSWDAEAPPRELRSRVLGVVASGGALGAASGTAAAASGAALGAAPKVIPAGIAGISKWVVVGVVVATGGALSGLEARSHRSAPAAAPAVAIAPPVAAPVALAPPVAAPVALASPRYVAGAPQPSGPEAAVPTTTPPEVVTEAPATPSPEVAVESRGTSSANVPSAPADKRVRRSSLPSVVAAAAPPAPSASAPAEARASLQLGNQVESVDRARAALAAGDPALARRLVDDYDAHFEGGILSQEATVIRIEALAKSGDSAGASALAASFLQAHPTSPHAARIRRLVGGAASNP